jgi:signal recognition particle subunit SRP19
VAEHHLYKLISKYLKDHPTTEDMALRYRYGGMPAPKEKPPPPAIPRGFKIGSILPLHSPALSGGGVSDNFMQDMLAEMGGQLPPGMESLAGAVGGSGGGAAPKKVKDKKKK